MRILGSRNAYDLLPSVEAGQLENGQEEADDLPLEPPEYDRLAGEEMAEEEWNPMEQMELDDPQVNEPLVEKVIRLRDRFSNNVVKPVKDKIVDPLAQLLGLLSDKIDYYLNKVGNPLILRRFFYIFMMSAIAYLVISSGFIPSERTSGFKGMFSDHEVLMEYARGSVDLSKFERDWEYISSMPHMSGTKGDAAIRHFVMETMNNNKLKLTKEDELSVYSSFPYEMSLRAVTGEESLQLNVSTENFNPLSATGELKGIGLIYGNMGSLEDLQKLKDAALLEDDFILMVRYGELVGEQILVAEKFGAKGVLFITDPYNGNQDIVQKKSVGIPQYWPGSPLSRGGDESDAFKDLRNIPRIPTMPLSWNQGMRLLSLLPDDGVQFEDGFYSGRLGVVHLDMVVQMDNRELHPAHNIICKIEGREQNDKAIIIAASRTSVTNGATYPAFGTAMLLSLIQMFQELKYKFDWKPLRNIYFVSYGGAEFNYAGSAGFTAQKLTKVKDHVYCMLDISQLSLESGSRKIDIQAHPLLHQFFSEENGNMGFDITVGHPKQYGDWIPLMANGIPVSVFSAPEVLKSGPPIETSEDVFDNVSTLLEAPGNLATLSDMILYVLQSSLKLVDMPFIPFDITEYVHYVDKLLEPLENNHSSTLRFQDTIKALLTWKKIGDEWSAWRKGWQNIVFSRDEGIEPSLISVHRWTWNKKLSNIGRRQCAPGGLKNRPYYKNVLFGPSFWTQPNDDSWSFPGIRDAINEQDWAKAQQELDIVANVLAESAALFLEETTDVGT
ncbi:hypothetical protein HG536_0A08030 [Torulaspora globosa]|uniref:Transferrin receptor-like dimerisation domain-containing protein n=1 Tax=Torulaspora globosa TaxID=48254 RepID=A0A7G3ZBV2_9SACH|nr:uncharacterized protein HG536_0A08030 [Torulaspora globosa]QLL30988.1 hypothetical protein HG536_0A08030 [Torulaspora globosa]